MGLNYLRFSIQTMVLPVILSAMLFLSTAGKILFNLQLKNPRCKERLHLLLNL